MSSITNSTELLNETLNNEKVLIKFYSKHCAPCNVLTNVINKIFIEDEYKNTYKIYNVDVEEFPSIAEEFNILSTPTTFIYKEGKLANRFEGVKPASIIKQYI